MSEAPPRHSEVGGPSSCVGTHGPGRHGGDGAVAVPRCLYTGLNHVLLDTGIPRPGERGEFSTELTAAMWV